MNRFLNVFRSTPKSTPAFRLFRPRLEQLDARLMPTLCSSAISIQHSLGWLSWTERAWYSTDNSTGQVVEFQDTTRHDLGGPRNVRTISASVDPRTGYAEVFVLDDSSALWLCDSS